MGAKDRVSRLSGIFAISFIEWTLSSVEGGNKCFFALIVVYIFAKKGRAMTTPNITIYHMKASRSVRVTWLLEELRLPYSTEIIEFDYGNAGGEAY